MAIKKQETAVDVVTAARQRIKNAFETGAHVNMNFSSGKDSACMSDITYQLCRSGEVDRKKLKVIFIDEEGIYPSMVEAAMRWKKRFESIGVPFLWFCLPFKQVSVIDSLSQGESWITWDPNARDRWMREPPPFAIMYHEGLKYPGEMNYQTFCSNEFGKKGDIQLVGARTAESFTRLHSVAYRRKGSNMVWPIYDWTDKDVWLYIKEHDLEFPEIYMRLYEAGASRKNLRLCAFFGEGGTQGLHRIAETDPDLWERICRREPNAELAMLYWDSEMFNRSTRKRRELEKDQEKIDYRAKLEDLLFFHTDRYRINKDTAKKLGSWRNMYKKYYYAITEKHCKKIYETLIFGDPKGRMLVTMQMNITSDYREGVQNGR